MNISHYFWEIKFWLVLVAAVMTIVNTQKDAEVLTVQIWRIVKSISVKNSAQFLLVMLL